MPEELARKIAESPEVVVNGYAFVRREGRIHVSLPSGVDFSFPILGNWRLEGATVQQLENMEIDDEGIHWPELNEDLCFEGLLKGDYGQYVRQPRSA